MTFFTVGPVGSDPLTLGNPATQNAATTVKQTIIPKIFDKFLFIFDNLLFSKTDTNGIADYLLLVKGAI